MKTFNVTAQIYKKSDRYKQTIFTNEVISADDKYHADILYKMNLNPEYCILKIYSIEECETII